MISISNSNGSQNLMSYSLNIQMNRNEINKIIRDAVKEQFEIIHAREELEKWIKGTK